MSEVDSLIEQWGSENVQQAFALQKTIKRRGLNGIHFMEAGEEAMESSKDYAVKAAIRQQMENRY